jgi:hypothetical protein
LESAAGAAVEPLTAGVEETAVEVVGCVTEVAAAGVASESALVAGEAVADCTTSVTGALVDAVEFELALGAEVVAVLA